MGRPTFIETRWVPVTALRDYPGNARIHDDATLDRIVEELGQASLLNVRPQPGEDGAWQILGGHGTRDALVRCGVTEVGIQVWEMDDATADAVVSALNRGSDGATYDLRAQATLLRRLDEAGMLSAGGWTDDEMDDAIAAAQELALPYLAAGSPDLADAIRVAAGEPAVRVGPVDVSELPKHYGANAEGDETSGVRSTPSLADYADRYAERATRALVMDLPLVQFSWLIERMRALREELGVPSNAEVLIELVAERSGDTPPSAGE